jgi:hypothetical protein
MAKKLDRRRARATRQRRGILYLWGTGRDIKEIARRTSTSPDVVARTLKQEGVWGLVSQEQQQQLSQEAQK